MKPLIAITAAAAVFASIALAHENHDHATGVVRERMELMTRIGKNLLAISKRVRRHTELARIGADARAIRGEAGKIAKLFPAGSTQVPTAAKQEIWANWPDFEAKAKALEAEAAKLMAVDIKDSDGLRNQLRAVARACDGCHEKYRVPGPE